MHTAASILRGPAKRLIELGTTVEVSWYAPRTAMRSVHNEFRTFSITTKFERVRIALEMRDEVALPHCCPLKARTEHRTNPHHYSERGRKRGQLTFALGHVWTAPWQETPARCPLYPSKQKFGGGILGCHQRVVDRRLRVPRIDEQSDETRRALGMRRRLSGRD